MVNVIKKVCIIGSGTMGCGIAAHLTNIGIQVLILDIKDDSKDNSNIRNNISLSSKAKPNNFYKKNLHDTIEIGNLEDDINKITDCDWIIEVIVENIKIKKDLFLKIDKILNENNSDAIVTSNTSGLSVNEMCEDTSLDFKRKFLVSHFFNPVRYLHLLEIVPNKETDQKYIDIISDFCERKLGKGVIVGKDTPNFIGNRIGVASMAKLFQAMIQGKYSVQEIDYIFGAQTGRPNSAVFKTLDLVGVDIFANVMSTCSNSFSGTNEGDLFAHPSFVTSMLKNKWLGRKTKGGFYKKNGKSIEILDVYTMEYKDKGVVEYASIKGAKSIKSIGEKLKFIFEQNDRASSIVKDMTLSTFIYSAEKIFEISDSVEDIDNAMKWGFNWEKGPFEICDVIGLKTIINLAKENKHDIPEWLLNEDLLSANQLYIFDSENNSRVWSPIEKKFVLTKKQDSKVLNFSLLKNNPKNIIKELVVTNLVDLGDQIAACEFNTKFNAVDGDVLSDISKCLDICEDQNYKGMVLYNEGGNFSVGMNLWLIYMSIMGKQFDKIEEASKQYQDLCVRLKYSPTVTIAAPYNLTLGGGAELSMWCNQIEAHAETYMGLVEVGVGLIPGAGGTVELMDRVLKNSPKDDKIPKDIVLSKALLNVAMATISTSAIEAKEEMFLTPEDGITVHKDNHLYAAKLSAMRLINSGFSTSRRRLFHLPGNEAYSNYNVLLQGKYEGGFISHHDLKISLKIAKLVSGGDCNPKHPVTEQYLLDMEREAFLSLCGEEKTLDRIKSMLVNKKPLRN
jgi:3-hydroxyacyl-CoA dehydrogenase